MDIKTDVVVVVPTIREANIREFLDAWRFPCRVIVVEDNPTKTFALEGVDHYAWDDIEAQLGADAWIIPRRTDCVRSFGYLKAYETGAPTIVTLDDDCLPAFDEPGWKHHSAVTSAFLTQHLDNLQPKPAPRWWSTLENAEPRGYPYETHTAQQHVAISHGLWTGTLDWDSLTQLQIQRRATDARFRHDLTGYRQGLVPRGQYYPMCGMNLAWRREYTVVMYFLLMGQNAAGKPWPFDRFGDIWAGILNKRVLDHLGVGVWSGAPFVHHSRASNVWANFRKEHAGIQENESFWQLVDGARLTGNTPAECYGELAEALADVNGAGYWSTVARAMHLWRHWIGRTRS